MKRKLIKNEHQVRLNIPIRLVRNLGFVDSVILKEVITPEGPGIVVLKDQNEEDKP